MTDVGFKRRFIERRLFLGRSDVRKHQNGRYREDERSLHTHLLYWNGPAGDPLHNGVDASERRGPRVSGQGQGQSLWAEPSAMAGGGARMFSVLLSPECVRIGWAG